MSEIVKHIVWICHLDSDPNFLDERSLVRVEDVYHIFMFSQEKNYAFYHVMYI